MEDEVAKPHAIIEHDKFHGINNGISISVYWSG
jgi:hypothetical protein